MKVKQWKLFKFNKPLEDKHISVTELKKAPISIVENLHLTQALIN